MCETVAVVVLQADLIDFSQNTRGKTRYGLAVMDVFTREAAVEPLQNKNAETVGRATKRAALRSQQTWATSSPRWTGSCPKPCTANHEQKCLRCLNLRLACYCWDRSETRLRHFCSCLVGVSGVSGVSPPLPGSQPSQPLTGCALPKRKMRGPKTESIRWRGWANQYYGPIMTLPERRSWANSAKI